MTGTHSNGAANGHTNGNHSNGQDNNYPAMATQQKLLQPLQNKCEDFSNKVTVVGVGQVGLACAFALFTQNVTNNIALVDMNPDKLRGELLDLQHGSSFMNYPNIQASTDYAVTAGSKICIVTAGVRQKEGETRIALMQRNADILKKVIPELLKYSPDTILLIATNPCDVMTYVTWKISGLPISRVIGSGTNLDSARFRFLLAQKLCIAPSSCNGYIIGEHGDSSVPVWSGVNVAGIRLTELHPNIGTPSDEENWNEIHTEVVQAAYKVIKAKGYTSWAVGLSLSDISRSILTNSFAVHPVSTCIKGHHGIEQDVFLSLPVTLGARGICDILQMPLREKEETALRNSAEAMANIQKTVKL